MNALDIISLVAKYRMSSLSKNRTIQVTDDLFKSAILETKDQFGEASAKYKPSTKSFFRYNVLGEEFVVENHTSNDSDVDQIMSLQR